MNGSKSSSAEVVQKVLPSNETQTQLEQDKNRETDSVHMETQEKLTEERAKYTPEQVVTEHLKNMVESGKLSPETISVLEEKEILKAIRGSLDEENLDAVSNGKKEFPEVFAEIVTEMKETRELKLILDDKSGSVFMGRIELLPINERLNLLAKLIRKYENLSDSDIQNAFQDEVAKYEKANNLAASREQKTRAAGNLFYEYSDVYKEEGLVDTQGNPDPERIKAFLEGEWIVAKQEIEKNKTKKKNNGLSSFLKGDIPVKKTSLTRLAATLDMTGTLSGKKVDIAKVEPEVLSQIAKVASETKNLTLKQTKEYAEGRDKDALETKALHYDLASTIPEEYWDSSYSKKYQKLLKEGKINKTFDEYLNEETNISGLERLGYTIAKFLRMLKKMFGNVPFLKSLFDKDKKEKTAREKELERLSKAKEMLKNRKEWKKYPKLDEGFKKLQNVVNIEDIHISPKEYEKRMKDENFKKVIDWAIKNNKGKISKEKFEELWSNKDNIKIEARDKEDVNSPQVLKINKAKFEQKEGDHFEEATSGWSDKLIEEVEEAQNNKEIEDQKLITTKQEEGKISDEVKTTDINELWSDKEKGILKPSIKSLLKLDTKFWGEPPYPITQEDLINFTKNIGEKFNDELDAFHDVSGNIAWTNDLITEEGKEIRSVNSLLPYGDIKTPENRFELDGTGLTYDLTFVSVKAFFNWLKNEK